MPITRMIPEKWETVDGKYQKVADAYQETFAQGATLDYTTNRSYQIMSDVWGTAKEATYWDDATGRPRTMILDVCDYSYSYGDQVHAEIDATEEVYAKLRNYLYEQELARVKAKAEEDAQVIRKGDIVEVYKGRNGKGTKGPIVVDIVRPYNMGWQSAMRRKFAIALNDEKIKVAAANGKVYENYKNVVWAWEHNVRLVNVPAIDMKEITETASELADSYLKNWKAKAKVVSFA